MIAEIALEQLLSKNDTYLADQPRAKQKLAEEYLYFIDIPERDAKIAFYAPHQPAWLHSVVSRIIHLLELPTNWNRSGEKRIDLWCTRDALNIINVAMQRDIAVPLIFPRSDGGVQLEWHQNGVDIEIEIPSLGRADLYFRDTDGIEWSGPLDLNFDRLKRVLQKITR